MHADPTTGRDPDARVTAELTAMVTELAGDWDHEGTVEPDTLFLADLGMESLDLVVLGTTLQDRYGPLPFAAFLADLGARPVEHRDVTIAELAAFVGRHQGGRADSARPQAATS